MHKPQSPSIYRALHLLLVWCWEPLLRCKLRVSEPATTHKLAELHGLSISYTTKHQTVKCQTCIKVCCTDRSDCPVQQPHANTQKPAATGHSGTQGAPEHSSVPDRMGIRPRAAHMHTSLIHPQHSYHIKRSHVHSSHYVLPVFGLYFCMKNSKSLGTSDHFSHAILHMGRGL